LYLHFAFIGHSFAVFSACVSVYRQSCDYTTQSESRVHIE